MISNNKFSHDEYGYPRTNEEIRLLEQNEQSDNIIKRLQSQIASLESQLREKEEHYGKLEVVANRWHNEYLRLESEKDEEIQSCIEQRDNVLNDFELYRAEKDKQIEAFKDIENIRSQATKNLCKENYDLRDEIERLKELFEKRGSAMQDLSEQVGLLSNKNNELREALRNILALYSGGFSHKDNKLFLDRCRKLIGE